MREYYDRIEKLKAYDNSLLSIVKEAEEDQRLSELHYDMIRRRAIRQYYLGY